MKYAPAQKTGIREQIDVCLGQVAIPIGQLTYVRQGQRENTTFAYSEQWLNDPQRFEILRRRSSTRNSRSQGDCFVHEARPPRAPGREGKHPAPATGRRRG
jgi:serine/threonine-protein kinase HipA